MDYNAKQMILNNSEKTTIGPRGMYTITGRNFKKEGNNTIYTIYTYIRSEKENLGEKKVFTGKSKCHPDDKYNIYIGMDIAEHRAMAKMYKYLKNLMNKRALKAFHMQSFYEYAAWKMDDLEEKQQSLINKLTNNE